MKFSLDLQFTKTVTIERDSDDVNILLDGIVVAWFSAIDESLKVSEHRLQEAGMKVKVNHVTPFNE